MRDARDIERTMRAHGDAVWRACLVYLPASDAEDVFQDVFLKYALSEKRFSINACKDVLKAARQRNASVDELVDEGREAALGATSDDDQTGLHEILAAMNKLGDPPKTQLYLALYEGYTAPEISKMTGMPEGTVYSWISRGKKKLREALS